MAAGKPRNGAVTKMITKGTTNRSPKVGSCFSLSLFIPNAKVTDDEERANDAPIGTCA